MDDAQGMTAESIIAARNKQFESMSPQQRMVAVCKEILHYATIKDPETVRISSGSYMNYVGAVKAEVSDLQQLLPVTTDCKICMLGAALFCKAKLFDHVALTDLGVRFDDQWFVERREGEDVEVDFALQRSEVVKQLLDIADPITLNNMEAAFERQISVTPVIDYRGFRLLTMTENITSPEIRAAVIAMDIIQHDGVLSGDSGHGFRYRKGFWTDKAADHFYGKMFFSQKEYDRDAYSDEQIIAFGADPMIGDEITYADRNLRTRTVDRHKDHERYSQLVTICVHGSSDHEYIELRDRRYSGKTHEIFATGRGLQTCEEKATRVFGHHTPQMEGLAS